MLFDYDCLVIIFKKLNARDLHNAARVCRFWNAVAKSEKRSRGASVLTFLGELKNSWTDLHPGEPFIDRLRIKPMLGFMFTNYASTQCMLPTQEHTADCPCTSLPSSCPNIIIGNYEVVTDQSADQSQDLARNVLKVASIFLPEERHVTVKTIFTPLENREEYTDELTWCLRQRTKLPTVKDKVNCIIFLTSYHDSFEWDPLDHIPQDRYESLCGGVVHDLRMCHRDENRQVSNRRMAWIGILISGTSVRSWTIVLSDRDNTKEKVESRLRVLKNRVELKKHSVGFVFSSCRGEHMFGEKNVETTIFKALFPEVPLIGTVGGARQYGDSTHDRMVKRTGESAVFMILTYG